MTGVGPIRGTLEQIRLGALGLALAACAVGGTAGSGGDASLAFCEVARTPLTIGDGSHPYVEPQNLLRLASGFLVAGLPSYTWSPERPSERVTADEHIAARFSLDGRATLIEKPIGGAIDRVRAVALGGDRWGAIFDEVSPDSVIGPAPLRGLWYAEHDGDQWVTLEALDLPEDGTVDLWGSTELVWTGESLVWIAAGRPQSVAIEYERRDGRWSQEVIPDAQIETSALAYDPGHGLLWAHFSEDPSLADWQQSLRLYRRRPRGTASGGARWQLVRRVVLVPGGVKIRETAVTPLPGGVTVTWRLEGGSAHAVVGIGRQGGGSPVDLHPSPVDVMAVRPSEREPLWIVSEPHQGFGSLQFTLFAPGSPFAPRRIGSLPTPFVGYQSALAISPTEMLVVGPQYEPDPPNPFLRSVILRLSTSCT